MVEAAMHIFFCADKIVRAEINRLNKLMQFVVNDMFPQQLSFQIQQKQFFKVFVRQHLHIGLLRERFSGSGHGLHPNRKKQTNSNNNNGFYVRLNLICKWFCVPKKYHLQ